MATVRDERRPQQPLVLGEDFVIAIAQRSHQAGRALDVAEEKRCGAGR